MTGDTAVRRVVVSGYVQGVGYRAWVEREATARDLEGWVRNRRDGTVEAVFSGPAHGVDAMVEACRRGPFSARVDEVQASPADRESLAARYPGEAFSVLPTR